MSAIGGVTCTFLRGALGPLKMRSLRWQVPGINGYGLALLGTADSECALRAVLYGSAAEIAAWATALAALQGQIVSALTDYGDASASVFVEKVSPPARAAAYIPGSGVDTRGEIEIRAVVVG